MNDYDWTETAREFVKMRPLSWRAADIANVLGRLADGGWIIDPDRHDAVCAEYAFKALEVERAIDALVAAQGGDG